MFAGLKQNHLKQNHKRKGYLPIEQTSNFKPLASTKLSAIYDDQMDMIEQVITREFRLNEAFWPELGSPWDHHPCEPQDVDKLRRGLSFPGRPFPFHER